MHKASGIVKVRRLCESKQVVLEYKYLKIWHLATCFANAARTAVRASNIIYHANHAKSVYIFLFFLRKSTLFNLPKIKVLQSLGKLHFNVKKCYFRWFQDFKFTRHGFLTVVDRCKMDHFWALWQLIYQHNIKYLSHKTEIQPGES